MKLGRDDAGDRAMIEAIRECLRQEMEADSRVMVIGEDVGQLGGVFRATDGLQSQFGRDRVYDMPLAEGVIVGSGIGLAISGLRPVVELQFLGFGHQAFHQIGQQVARLRFRSQGRHSLPMVIRAPFGGGVRTPELHSDAFEAYYAHTPGLKVVVPSNPYFVNSSRVSSSTRSSSSASSTMSTLFMNTTMYGTPT